MNTKFVPTGFTPTMLAGAAAGRPSVIQLNIKGVTALYLSYIPYFKNGGLFIPTSKPYKIGESIYALVTLMDNPQRFAITGSVAWITPPRSPGQRPQGIGIHLPDNEQCQKMKALIENLLTKFVPRGRVSHTL
ncbi:MAG: PilZ domain-containing protein [Shewanella sp.]